MFKDDELLKDYNKKYLFFYAKERIKNNKTKNIHHHRSHKHPRIPAEGGFLFPQLHKLPAYKNKLAAINLIVSTKNHNF